MEKSLKLLSILLDYPTAEVQHALVSFIDFLNNDTSIEKKQRKRVIAFMDMYRNKPLLEWQQEYTQVFDYTPSASLYLFDHIHGESRQRGAAMVNLKLMYEDEGLELSANELPDYLPVFLAFLGETKSMKQAADYLAEVKDVLEDILKSLEKSESNYQYLLKCLLSIASKGKASEHPADSYSDELSKACAGCLFNQEITH
ncbi:MAG: nitrate reductase molybdenum cofactor assembly chaperone [Bacteroidales bacterium]